MKIKNLAFVLALVCSTFSNMAALSDDDRRMAAVAKLQEIVATGKRNDAAILARAASHKAQFDKEIEALELLKIQRNEKICAVVGMSVVIVVTAVAGYCFYKWLKNRKPKQQGDQLKYGIWVIS